MRTLVIFFVSSLLAAHAEDWPTYGHDNRRSHVSKETLKFPLEKSWSWQSPVLPQTAWTGPARWDAYASNEGLQSMRNFDPAFFVTSVGDSVFFGSSADHGVHCLNVANGEERWVTFADAAVRLPPTWKDGRLYFGADDGYARCLDAASGKELWKFNPVESARMIPSNGKLMSPFPVRTGVLVDDGLAYFGASLFPWEKSYLCAVDIKTGRDRFVSHLKSVTLQGILLSSAERLYAPQGRSVPLVFAKTTGSRIGDISGTGGVFCILTEDEHFISIPHNQKASEDTVKLTNPANRESVINIPGANQMLADGNFVYFHQRNQLKAVNRFSSATAQNKAASAEKTLKALVKAKKDPDKQAQLKKTIALAKEERKSADTWASFQPVPSAMILAGNHLILGGDGIVFAVEKDTGKQIWKANITGRIYGLAAANGRLFASTNRGEIISFISASH
jgi:outer membrane protein assembly factor BamB